jgi:hypothetical protein
VIDERAPGLEVAGPFVEIGAVPLSANSLAIGNLRYLKSAIDAAEGNGSRISPNFTLRVPSLMPRSSETA